MLDHFFPALEKFILYFSFFAVLQSITKGNDPKTDTLQAAKEKSQHLAHRGMSLARYAMPKLFGARMLSLRGFLISSALSLFLVSLFSTQVYLTRYGMQSPFQFSNFWFNVTSIFYLAIFVNLIFDYASFLQTRLFYREILKQDRLPTIYIIIAADFFFSVMIAVVLWYVALRLIGLFTILDVRLPFVNGLTSYEMGYLTGIMDRNCGALRPEYQATESQFRELISTPRELWSITISNVLNAKCYFYLLPDLLVYGTYSNERAGELRADLMVSLSYSSFFWTTFMTSFWLWVVGLSLTLESVLRRYISPVPAQKLYWISSVIIAAILAMVSL